MCSPRYTAPAPPAPRSESSLYLPAMTRATRGSPGAGGSGSRSTFTIDTGCAPGEIGGAETTGAPWAPAAEIKVGGFAPTPGGGGLTAFTPGFTDWDAGVHEAGEEELGDDDGAGTG